MAPVPWIAVVSLVAGAGTVGLIARLWQYRGKPGANWFLLALGFQTVWSVTYGVASLVANPTARWALEVVVWAAIAGTGIYFLAFALTYTGRGHVVETWWFRGLLAVPPLTLPLVGTNPLHRLAWTDFAVESVAGAWTATYTIQPLGLAGLTAGVLLVLVGTLVLFDTVVSYGPLYRSEAIAVGLSTIPVSVALILWLYRLGPVPALNLATVAFLPHIALDAYAFLGSDMFEFHPATRRAGERAAIDDLGAPVVIVDEGGRVVTLNAAACDSFDTEKRAALTEPLADVLGTTIDPADPGDALEIRGAGVRRIYAVTSTPLSDGTGTHVGYTVVFQDVTEERRREQRLDVLNRVLRHNLRNDMDVVRGFAAAASDAVDDPTASDYLDTIESKADDLLSLGQQARAVERVIDRERTVESVALETVVSGIVDDLGTTDVVRVDVGGLTVRTDPGVLEVVLESLVDNAVEHGRDDGDADVTVTAERTAGAVLVRITDQGPGIPDHELEVLDAGAESALEHGSGLGLWLANWGVSALGGSLSFDTGDDGTTATVRLPEPGDNGEGPDNTSDS